MLNTKKKKKKKKKKTELISGSQIQLGNPARFQALLWQLEEVVQVPFINDGSSFNAGKSVEICAFVSAVLAVDVCTSSWVDCIGIFWQSWLLEMDVAV